MPDNPEAGNYDDGDLGEEGGYFPSQSILPTQTQGMNFHLLNFTFVVSHD